MAKNIVLTFEYDLGDWEAKLQEYKQETGADRSLDPEDWQDYVANSDILLSDLDLVNVRIRGEKMSQPMKVLTSTKTVEYYTPKYYVDMVKEVFDGTISLDPASCQKAQETVRASAYFGLDHPDEEFRDGLKPAWDFSVDEKITIFCNPPYNSQARHWTAKAEREYAALKDKFDVQMIFLVNANMGYKWFDDLRKKYYVCIPDERISFINEKGEVAGKAKKASAFIYIGEHSDKFEKVFKPLGTIL